MNSDKIFQPKVPCTELPLAVLYDRRLNDAERITYITISRFNKKKGPGNYPVKDVAKALNAGVRTIQMHTKKLEEIGLINIIDQRGTLNVYEVVDPREVYYGNDVKIAQTLRLIYEVEEVPAQ